MVFPTLPVIPIICAEVLSLVTLAKSFRDEKVFFTFIILFLEICFIFLLITDLTAPFLIASLINLWPSVFFPRIAKNRLFFLGKIIESFLDLVSINKGELKAKLVSSKKLSIEEQKNIQNELSKDFKSPLNIDYEYDPDLIAGLIIQVGSVMVDTSIKTRLKK